VNNPSPSTPKSGAKASQSQSTPTAGDETGCRDYGDGRPTCDPKLTRCVQDLDRALHGLRSGRPPERLANWNRHNATTSLFDKISDELNAYYPKEGEKRPIWECSSSSPGTPTGG
jgi:hypothetical protein